MSSIHIENFVEAFDNVYDRTPTLHRVRKDLERCAYINLYGYRAVILPVYRYEDPELCLKDEDVRKIIQPLQEALEKMSECKASGHI